MTTNPKAYLSAIASAALLMCASQAHANPFIFTQSFNQGGITGVVSGTFSAVDANLDTQFDASEITFLTLGYVGTVPTLGAVNLSYTPPNIVPDTLLRNNWFANGPGATDTNLGSAGNGFNVTGDATTTTVMRWLAGPLNGFAFGNTNGSGGDPQNSTFDFGAVSFFTGSAAGDAFLGNATSQTYVSVTAVPEPATYLMMLGGVAALLAGVRRRLA
jgi:hypothetical protein